MSKKSDRKAKFPKKVGGVPIPKKLRKAAAKIMAAAASPVGLELIAAGFSMAAAVERGRAKGRADAKAGKQALLAERDASSGGPLPQLGNDPHEVGVALGKMAEAALGGLFRQKG